MYSGIGTCLLYVRYSFNGLSFKNKSLNSNIETFGEHQIIIILLTMHTCF